jgi:FkbM family methyltransferase
VIDCTESFSLCKIEFVSVIDKVNVYNDLKFQFCRVTGSLFSCASCKYDALFKTTTLVNLAKKGMKAIVSKPITGNPLHWLFNDTLVKVDFKGLTYYFLCPKGHDFNVYLNPYYHGYDVVSFVFSVLQEGDVVIDVGAHGGLYTLLSGKIVGSEGKIISIEPNPDNLKFLRQNVKLNQLNNTNVISKAASDEKLKIKLHYETKKTALTSAVTDASKTVEVETMLIDEVTEKYDSIKLLKIDTEGYDYKILKGAQCTLQKTHYLVIEQNTAPVKALLSKHGFSFRSLFPSGYLIATNKNARIV